MNISGIRPAVGFYDYNSIKQAEEVGEYHRRLRQIVLRRFRQIQRQQHSMQKMLLQEADRPLVHMIMQTSMSRMRRMSLREQIVIFVH